MKVLKSAKPWTWEFHFYRYPLIAHAKLGPIIETGSSLSRVYDHTQKRNIAALTAYRGVPSNATEAEKQKQAHLNKSNNAKLHKMIRDAGFGFIPVKGRYVENQGTEHERAVTEESFLIIGTADEQGKKDLLTLAKKWGKEFGQDSIMFKPYDETNAYLHFTSGDDTGEVIKLGGWHPNKIGQYFSELTENKTTFAFGEKEDLQDRPNKPSENVNKKKPGSWFFALTLEGRKQYLKEHPNSGYEKYLKKDLPKNETKK